MDGNALQLLTSGVTRSPLSIEDIYRNRGVLIVRLPETGLGNSATQFLGSLLFSRLYRAARNGPQSDGRPFFIYVDEFQRFVTHEVEELVAEARKFNVSLTLAHQNLRQLEPFSRYEGRSNSRLAESLFSNVGTMVVMKTSGRDVSSFAAELQVKEMAVRNIGQYEALTRAVIDGSEQPTFTLKVPLAQPTGGSSLTKQVRDRMVRAGIMVARSELGNVRVQLESFRAGARGPTLSGNVDEQINPWAKPLEPRRKAAEAERKARGKPRAPIP
jgi:hypothetical protein